MRANIQIDAYGYCCTSEMILDVLFKASAESSSVEATCADLEAVADSNTIRLRSEFARLMRVVLNDSEPLFRFHRSTQWLIHGNENSMATFLQFLLTSYLY
jgi:hypothetical protein